jgi:hypothetical protein
MQHNHSHGSNINNKISLEFKHLNNFIKYKIYWGLSKVFKEARRNKRSGMWWGDQQLWYWCAFNSLDFLMQRPPIHWKYKLKSIENNPQFTSCFMLSYETSLWFIHIWVTNVDYVILSIHINSLLEEKNID